MSLLVPAQHPHDAEGAPTAGLSLALVHGEVQLARMGFCSGHRPSLPRRFSTKPTASATRSSGVTPAAHRYSSPPEYVVVVIGGVREERPGILHNLTRRESTEHSALQEVFLRLV